MGDMTKNFSRKEFACKCGCGFDTINPKIVAMCQELRDAMNEQIRVTSGCRCEKRNKEAGSTSKNHIHGNAADLVCASGHVALWFKAKELHAKGGLKDLELCILEGSWVHIDCDRKRSQIFQKI